MKAHLLADDLNYILSKTAKSWEQMRNQRVFITGGTGFFGCWLLESFIWANKQLNLNAEAVVLTRNPESFVKKYPQFKNQPGLSFHTGDVRTFTPPAGQFAYVIHAATEVSVAQCDGLAMLDTIVEGTKHTLDFATRCGAKKILYVSSGAVYGKQPSKVTHISEEFHIQPALHSPNSSYAIGKCTAEHLCALYAKRYGLEIKIARCFAFVGPYLSLTSHHAIGNFINHALEGNPIVINGDGTPYRSYLYAADLAVWLWTILFHGEAIRPYNVGSDEALTIAELAQIISTLSERKLDITVMKHPTVNSEVERYVPDITRAKRELNLTVQLNLKQAIQATYQWFSAMQGEQVCK